MRNLTFAVLAAALCAAPTLALEAPNIPMVQDAAQAEAAVKSVLARAPKVGDISVELAPLLLVLPYGAEFDGIDSLRFETLEDARAIAGLRLSYWEKVTAVLSEEAARQEAEQRDIKEESLSAEPMSELVKRALELVRLQRLVRAARMIASDAAADVKDAGSITDTDLNDKAFIERLGQRVRERKLKLFAALTKMGNPS